MRERVSMSLVIGTAVFLIIVCVLWNWYEGRWDRQLFSSSPGRICENLRPSAAANLLRARPETQVLDVRSAAEFALGALPGAINISSGSPSFHREVAKLDRTKPVLVYCAGGFRSRKAVKELRDLGFESIHHLHRGYMSWRGK